MNDEALKKTLQLLQIPKPDSDVRARALHRATIALANTPMAKAKDISSGTRSILWRCSAGLCALAIVMAACLVWVNAPRPVHDTSLATAERILGQMERLFPGQLDAVIERNGDVEVELAAEPVSPSEQPLIVKLARNDRVVRVLSYSGRRVCLDLNGNKTCFEALLADDGTVILTGENFLWSKRHPSTLVGYRVEATAIIPSS